MAVGIRLELEFMEPEGDGRATVGDIRRWLASADKFGASDDDELFMLMTERDDVNGFFVYGTPAD
ncbi:hypothetical protein [Paeniglutamicibacter gangotriensis]|uniref:hypothetical protein n=1 Tax=Paeniglutamicibacter gangotriensis TaxID=254787 RepID=UPI00034C876E|nr:hypothetical protein [Paeniglutamicibacter gangotriensis]